MGKTPLFALTLVIIAMGAVSAARAQAPGDSQLPGTKIPSDQDKLILFSTALQSDTAIYGKYLDLIPWKDGKIELRWRNVPLKKSPDEIIVDPMTYTPGCISTPTFFDPAPQWADAATKVVLSSEFFIWAGGMPEFGAPSNFRLMMIDDKGKVTEATHLIPGKSIDQIDNGFNMPLETTPCK